MKKEYVRSSEPEGIPFDVICSECHVCGRHRHAGEGFLKLRSVAGGHIRRKRSAPRKSEHASGREHFDPHYLTSSLCRAVVANWKGK